MSGTDLKEREKKASEHESIDGGLSPAESAKLDQIEAGINDGGDEDDGGDEEKEEFPYVDEGGSPRKAKISRKRKIFGGLMLAVGAGGIGSFLIFTPALRLESYMARVNQRAFALAGSAVENRASHLLERYMISTAINLDRCGNAVSTTCRADYSRSGIAGGLFATWRDVRVENIMANRYGIKIESLKNPDTAAGANRFKVTDRNGQSVTLNNGDLERGNFTGGNRQIGRDLRKYLRQETKWYEVMHRRSVRKYLTRKHNMKLFCFFACKTRDNAEVRATNARTRFKYRFVERFVFPFSGKYGLIMNCIIAGDNRCSSGDELRRRGLDRNRVPDADITDVVKFFKDNPGGRLGQYVLERLLTKVIGQTAARGAVSAIPVAGQIYLALTIIDIFDRMDGFIENKGLSRFAADINSRQYLEYYVGMRSISDELKSNVLNLDEIGAVMTDFDTEFPAEESLVAKAYDSEIKGASFTPAERKDDGYRCRNGKPIAPTEYVCPEKKLGRTFTIEDWRSNKVVDGVVTALNLYDCLGIKVGEGCAGFSPKSVIRPTLKGIDNIIATIAGPVVDALIAGLRIVPGIGSLISFGETKAKDLGFALLNSQFPLPVGVDSPGREKRDGIEAGGDIASAEFAKGGYTPSNEPYGLGAPKLTDKQAAVITRDFLEKQEYDYKTSGFFARLTNRDYPNSFANNLIAKIPSKPNQIPTQVATSLSGSLGGLFNMQLFGSVLGSSSIGAQTIAQGDINAFGVVRHGYQLDDPGLTRDPAELDEESCKKIREDWEKSKVDDELTGIDEYSVPNPCLLELVTVEAAGDWFKDE